jgi:outer membrane lipopolysaccharide assembly protein LptE/RlpB
MTAGKIRFWVAQRFSAAIRTLFSATALAALSLAAIACGYHTVGHTVALPQNVHIIAIPGFVSQSQTFRVEQRLTDAVVREFNTRTQFHVILEARNDADATLKGTVLSASATPLAYDSQTGRAASALVTVSMQVTLTDRQGKVLFQNPSYLFHEQYELSRDLPGFFEEDSPAVDRLSRDFARTLVANILEAY